MGQFGTSLGNQNVTDPRQARWGDLDSSERAARLISGGARGFGQGLQNYMGQQMPQGAGKPIDPFQFVPPRTQPKLTQPRDDYWIGGTSGLPWYGQ